MTRFALALVGASLLAPATASASAGIYPQWLYGWSEQSEVLVEVMPDRIAVTYKTIKRSDPVVGWVIPIDGQVLSITEADPARFQELREATAFRQLDVAPGAPTPTSADGGGCGCSGRASTPSEEVPMEVLGETALVFDTTATKTHDYEGTYLMDVFDAADQDGIVGWMAPFLLVEEIEPDLLEHYGALGGQTVLVYTQPIHRTEAFDMPLLRIEYAPNAAGQFSFPALMARDKIGETQRTTVYVVGEDRATVAGWTSTDVAEVPGVAGDDPWALIDARLAEVGADQGYARTWAGAFEGGYLTRFDTLAPREVHTVDPVFATGDGDEPLTLAVLLETDGSAPSDTGSGAAAGLAVGALLVASRRRGRT